MWKSGNMSLVLFKTGVAINIV